MQIMEALILSGYTRTGPYFQVCKLCGQKIGINCRARGGHEKGKRHQAAREALKAKQALRLPPPA